MLFTSIDFICFVLIALVIYYIVPKKLQWIVLLSANLYFYLQTGWGGLIYICTTIVTTYICGLSMGKLQIRQKKFFARHKETITREEKKIYKEHCKRKQKIYLTICLLLNFGILAVLKYTNFIIINFTNLSTIDFLVPMGISFYTFQSMGYLIDVYRGAAKAETNVFRFALFVSFFPQLVQGPIGRWNDLTKTLFEEHEFEWKRISFGFERILWGYFKKLVIADRAAVIVAAVSADVTTYKGAYALLGLIMYAIQLYADFTGGIDITIGIAQMFGVTVTENFKRPMFSKNISEYWRRWHITLCAWFKDYLFYPISMSHWMIKLSKAAKKKIGNGFGQRLPIYTASIIVWSATGIWHGAKWNFVVWGLLNAFFMLGSQECQPLYHKLNEKIGYRNLRYYKVFEIIRTVLLMCSLQVLDYYSCLSDSVTAYFSIFTTSNYGEIFNGGLSQFGLKGYDYAAIIIGVFIIFMVSMIQRKGAIRERIYKWHFVPRYVLYLALFLVIVVFGRYGIGFESGQFIYNQF